MKKLALLTAAGLLATTAANATLVSFNNTARPLSIAANKDSGSITVPAFTARGTLNSVTLDITITSNVTVSARNFTTKAQIVRIAASLPVTITPPAGAAVNSTITANVDPKTTTRNGRTTFNTNLNKGTNYVVGDASVILPGVGNYTAASTSVTYTSNSPITQTYTTAPVGGKYTINFGAISTMGTLLSSAGATQAASSDIFFGAIRTGASTVVYNVVYDYTPTIRSRTGSNSAVPAPASLGLIGFGLVGLGLARRRRG